MEDNLEREKKHRADVEKAKRKLEADLKMTQETVDDLERVRTELEANVKRYVQDLYPVYTKQNYLDHDLDPDLGREILIWIAICINLIQIFDGLRCDND